MSGIASFVGGVFDGMDWRESRDDRKRRRDIEDKELARDDVRFRWEGEDRDYEKRVRDREEKDRADAAKIKADEMAIWVGNGPGVKDEPVQSAPRNPEPTPQNSEIVASNPPPAVTRADLGAVATVAAAASAPRAASPGVVPATDAAHAPIPSYRMAGVEPNPANDASSAPIPSYRMASPAPDASRVQAPAITEVDPTRSAVVQDYQGLMRASDVQAATRQIGTGLSMGNYGDAGSPAARLFGGVKDYFTATPEEGTANAERRAKVGEAASWFQSDDAVKHFAAAPSALAVAKQDPLTYYEAFKRVSASQGAPAKPAPAPVQAPAPSQVAQQAPAPQQAVAPATGPATTAPPARQAPAAAPVQTSQAATPTMPNGTPMPSVAIAQQVVAEAPGIVGKGTDTPITKKQVETATDALMDKVRERAPALIDHYVKTGQLEKATAFAAFLDDAKVKDGMRAWGRVVTTAAVGDQKGFAKAVVDAYNAPGYYDDGYTAVAGKTRLTTDEKGNVTGAVVGFRNDATGEEFERTFEDVGDLYEQATQMLSPEAVFEQGYQSHKEAAAYELAVKRAKVDAANAGIDFKSVMNVVETLGKSSIEFQQLSPDEQIAKAIEFMRGVKGGNSQAPQDVSVLR